MTIIITIGVVIAIVTITCLRVAAVTAVVTAYFMSGFTIISFQELTFQTSVLVQVESVVFQVNI